MKLHDAPLDEEIFELSEAPEGQEIGGDCALLGLSRRRQPVAIFFVRQAAASGKRPHGPDLRRRHLAPAAANRATQVIAWKRVRKRQRQALLASILLGIQGKWQFEGGKRSLVAQRLVDLGSWLGKLATSSPDFK